MKKNIQDAWWNHFVASRRDTVGLDSSVILYVIALRHSAIPLD